MGRYFLFVGDPGFGVQTSNTQTQGTDRVLRMQNMYPDGQFYMFTPELASLVVICGAFCMFNNIQMGSVHRFLVYTPTTKKTMSLLHTKEFSQFIIYKLQKYTRNKYNRSFIIYNYTTCACDIVNKEVTLSIAYLLKSPPRFLNCGSPQLKLHLRNFASSLNNVSSLPHENMDCKRNLRCRSNTF